MPADVNDRENGAQNGNEIETYRGLSHQIDTVDTYLSQLEGQYKQKKESIQNKYVERIAQKKEEIKKLEEEIKKELSEIDADYNRKREKLNEFRDELTERQRKSLNDMSYDSFQVIVSNFLQSYDAVNSLNNEEDNRRNEPPY